MEYAIWLHWDDVQTHKVLQCAGGLYAHDITNPSHKLTTHIVNCVNAAVCADAVVVMN